MLLVLLLSSVKSLKTISNACVCCLCAMQCGYATSSYQSDGDKHANSDKKKLYVKCKICNQFVSFQSHFKICQVFIYDRGIFCRVRLEINGN